MDDRGEVSLAPSIQILDLGRMKVSDALKKPPYLFKRWSLHYTTLLSLSGIKAVDHNKVKQLS